MRLISPEFFAAVGMYIRKFQNSTDEVFAENVREAEEEFSLLLEEAEPCCALCARIEAWRSIALSLRDLDCVDDRLTVGAGRRHEAIDRIRRQILPPLCAEQRALFEAEGYAFDNAFFN